MTSQSIIQGIVLLLYLIAMVMVGFVFYKKNSTHSDYVLGGRGMERLGNVTKCAGFG